MTTIWLNEAVPSTRRLQRVHMFAGRHLGEDEFDRKQDYADARVAPLLSAAQPGIVRGLEIKGDGDGFSVSPGLAVAANGLALGLYHPLRAEWLALIAHWLRTTGGTDATGVYYLALRRASRAIDAPTVDPCQRTEFDPTRDSRLVVVGTPVLHRLAIPTGAVTTMARERIENWITADRIDGRFLATMGHAVPLALLAIHSENDAHNVLWLSPAAGRYEAVPGSGYRVLLNQTTGAMRRVMQRAERELDPGDSLEDFLAAELHLDFLPATGELPRAWLRTPAAPSPSLRWLPPHLRVDMVVVPEEAVAELVGRHLERRVIDLRQPAGDRIRLLLAVNEPDYRPDLLDIPPTDAQLENDIYRLHRRSHDAWRKWHEQFDVLYHFDESDALDEATLRALDLPQPLAPPPTPDTVFENVAARAAETVEPEADGSLPYPYNLPTPPAPADYEHWLVTPDDGGDPVPPAVTVPGENGLVIRYALTERAIEAAENRIRAARARHEKTRDFLMLQRQQLDSQTVSLAALAGGVAGDGSGLQVARWMPYARFESALAEGASLGAALAERSAGGGTSGELREAATGDGLTATRTTEPTPLSTDATTTFSASPTRSTAPATTLNLGQLATGSTATRFGAPAIAAMSTTTSSPAFSIGTAALTERQLTSAASSLFVAPTTLTAKPQTFSAFELGINQQRIAALASVAKRTISTPAFMAREHHFGVLEHIRPEVNEYARAFQGMQDLLRTLSDLFDAPDARSLRRKLLRAGSPEDPDDLESRIGDGSNGMTRDEATVHYRYKALFEAGKTLTQWVAIVEGRYSNLERRLQGLLREHSRLLTRLAKLAALIRRAREELDNLDRQRLDMLGDFGLAQRLLGENREQIYRRSQERARILTSGLRGLYYVRLRSSPVSELPADPLALRTGRSSDVVPGCDWEEDVDLPEELNPFFAAVTEIPMSDWATLKPLQPRIPLQTLQSIDTLRKARFDVRATSRPAPGINAALLTHLAPVLRQNQAVLGHWAGAVMPPVQDRVSHGKTRERAAKVLSLEDLATHGTALLRRRAETLRERLEQCQYCLYEHLRELPPSIRFEWAQLAEDDRLRVEDVAWWPGLDRAERHDFNTARTVAELVAWWFRQLDREASADARSAMRNMIRTNLIHAALGDPSGLVHGRISIPPRRNAIGERIRIALDREPPPNAKLQLLDAQQKLVAVLAIEDYASHGADARIVEVVDAGARITEKLHVVVDRTDRRRLKP
ncbi:hypothetical protein [Halomonas sp. BM-2019]|uniref:hypothetical protein n=1 Tax=Halomonas sp. BM-2019 TaxID=2811227 RepID=UPI001B3C2429|nr:MAG: hypothetical protein J5F18_09760 [Halomonas sp. BM-2019]